MKQIKQLAIFKKLKGHHQGFFLSPKLEKTQKCLKTGLIHEILSKT